MGKQMGVFGPSEGEKLSEVESWMVESLQGEWGRPDLAMPPPTEAEKEPPSFDEMCET